MKTRSIVSLEITSAYCASPLLVSRASRSAVASFSQLEADRKVLKRAHRPGSTGPVASNSPPSLLLLLWQRHLEAIICRSRASRRTMLSLILSGVTDFATTIVTMVVASRGVEWSGLARLQLWAWPRPQPAVQRPPVQLIYIKLPALRFIMKLAVWFSILDRYALSTVSFYYLLR